MDSPGYPAITRQLTTRSHWASAQDQQSGRPERASQPQSLERWCLRNQHASPCSATAFGSPVNNLPICGVRSSMKARFAPINWGQRNVRIKSGGCSLSDQIFREFDHRAFPQIISSLFEREAENPNFSPAVRNHHVQRAAQMTRVRNEQIVQQWISTPLRRARYVRARRLWGDTIRRKRSPDGDMPGRD